MDNLELTSAHTNSTDQWMADAAKSGLKALMVGGPALLPIVQGGMDVGVSAHCLAGTVASHGAMGTIASVDLRHHHPDLVERTSGLPIGTSTRTIIDAANLEALRREIALARTLEAGKGMLAVNAMRAVNAYADLVRTALESGIDAAVVGAGLPLDLPDLAREYLSARLFPILSDARGEQLVFRKWERKGRIPSADVIEHPRDASGHLGATRLSEVNDPRFDFEHVVPAAREFLRAAGVESQIPLIATGGVRSFADVQRLQSLGAAAVQRGTPLAVTVECDAHPEFKRVLAAANDDDTVEFQSVAGLPARAVRSAWMNNYLKAEATLKANAHKKSRCTKKFDCLAHCGFRHGIAEWGQFCFDNQLVAALLGDLKKGLFFRGAGSLPFGTAIRSVRELLERMLTPPGPRTATV